jgi:mono/diheme cytochrome c family protein
VAPGARDPEQRLPGAEASVFLAWLDLMKSGTAPAAVSTGERSQVALVFREGCIGCHRIDGSGGTMGPDLAGAGKRVDKQWIINYLPNPEAVNPEARMRSYPDLTPAELDSIATYVMGL